MSMINVDEAINKLTKEFDNLSEKEINSAIVSAINRVLQMGRTEGEKQIKNVYNIKNDVLKNSFATNKARSSLLIGELKASTEAIQLSHFQPTFSFTKRSSTSYNKKGIGATKLLKRDSSSYGQGVSIEIIKGQRKSIPYAFMIAGKKPVFARGDYQAGGNYAFIQRHKRTKATGSDTPITSLVNISVYSSIVNDKVMPSVAQKIDDKFEERLLHELNYRISKMKP